MPPGAFKMKALIFILCLALAGLTCLHHYRNTPAKGRGFVVVKTSQGVYKCTKHAKGLQVRGFGCEVFQ